MDGEKLRSGLADAGCTSGESDVIVQLCMSGNMKEALHRMKKNRCSRMDELHETGRKVDLLDILIRQTEKEMKHADN